MYTKNNKYFLCYKNWFPEIEFVEKLSNEDMHFQHLKHFC